MWPFLTSSPVCKWWMDQRGELSIVGGGTLVDMCSKWGFSEACLHRNQTLESLFAFFLEWVLVYLCGCEGFVMVLVICEFDKLLWIKYGYWMPIQSVYIFHVLCADSRHTEWLSFNSQTVLFMYFYTCVCVYQRSVSRGQWGTPLSLSAQE